ncbi:MAG: sugar phosphate isomerase/epimerase [Clostridia bacterium]|nr:sugar phosphate isomerase/epimerase [Clostridia bacterium]
MHQAAIFHEHILEGALQRGMTVLEACRQAKEMGYYGVNMDLSRLKNDFEGTMQPLRESGLAVHCVYAFTDFGLEEDSLSRDMEVIRENVQLVKKCGSKNMLTVAGFLRPHEMDRKSVAYRIRRERVKKAVAALAEEAVANGIQLTMEDFDGDKALFCFGDELFDFVSTVPGLKCAFDTGNFMYGCEDAWELLPRFLPYISDVHLKDRGLAENGGSPCIALDGRKLYPVPVGGGVIPMEKIMRMLLDSGYTGHFAAEHFGSADQMRDMELSIAFIRRVTGK